MKGELFGVIPYDFERPTFAKVKERLWNPHSDNIFVPQVFGVGWTVNLAALKRRYPPAFYGLIAIVAWRVVRKLRSARAS